MKKILVTGAAGFVGTHLVEHILKNTDWEITVLDRFDVSGNPNRLADMLFSTKGIDPTRVKGLFWDLKAELNDQIIKQLDGPFDYIAHLAAGSHVDRSIEDPLLFFQDNAIGTVNLLNYAKKGGLTTEKDVMYLNVSHANHEQLKDAIETGGTVILPSDVERVMSPDRKITGKFLYFSTDEVYGPFPMDEEGGFKEWARLNPNNPYAAAKAAAEMAVIAYANTYSIPCVITNTMNIFGERQHPEKYIPLIIKKVLTGETLYIHSNKEKTRAGKRHYLHARNISAGTVWILEHGETLDGSATKGRYNVVGEIELDNLILGQKVAAYTNEWLVSKGLSELPFKYELVDFHSSRPGHDLRYALDGTHLKEAGFSYPVSFEESLKKMVFWTLDNKEKWL